VIRHAADLLDRLPRRLVGLARRLVRGVSPDGPRTADDLPRWSKRWPLLYVDDQPESLVLARLMFERCGLSMIATRYPYDAWTICHHVPLSLVISNIMMPEMDGYQLCRALKADPGTHHLPIMFFSVLFMPKDILKGFEVGGLGYLGKPVTHPHLLAIISAMLLAHGNWRISPPQPHREMIRRLTHPARTPFVPVSMADPRLDCVLPAPLARASKPFGREVLASRPDRRLYYVPEDIPRLRAVASFQR